MTRWWLTAGFSLTVCAIALSGQSPAAPPPQFHHVHLRVDDPAASMDLYARSNGCTKRILQGLGVGVRCGTTYILLDRNDQPAAVPTVRGRVSVTGSGDAAVVRVELAVADGAAIDTWLRDRIGVASKGALSFVPVASGPSLPDEIAHIAVGLPDPAPLVSRVTAAGARVLVKGPESTTVAGPSGLAIEVVHDAGTGPDAYWCAMHPDVRSPSPGKCPICAMTLVPIPPPVFGDDRMDVAYKPSGTNRGRLTLRIVDRATNKPRTTFVTVHDRPFHLFIVNRDLSFFDHVHPQLQKDGSLTLDVTLPRPDLYMLYGDFYPGGGTPQLLQSALVTPGYDVSPFPDPVHVPADPRTTKGADGSRVTLVAPPLTAGGEATVTFEISDAKTGGPVTDLEPYLGAAGHLFMVSDDLTDADHSHPTDFAAKGPKLTFHVRPPRAGVYRLWVQFQRAGKLVTMSFTVTAMGS